MVTKTRPDEQYGIETDAPRETVNRLTPTPSSEPSQGGRLGLEWVTGDYMTALDLWTALKAEGYQAYLTRQWVQAGRPRYQDVQ